MSKEAMKLALEALKELVAQIEGRYFCMKHDHVALQNARFAIARLREALAEQKSGIKQVIELYDSPDQPSQQEPVAYMGTDSDGNPNKFRLNPFSGCVSLYEKPSPVQKPVAYMDICEKNQMSGLRYWSEPDNRHEVPLYTSPKPIKPWVEITPEELMEASNHYAVPKAFAAGAAWANAKLKEKNA